MIVLLNQVDVIHPRLAAAKVLSPWNASLTAALVPGLLESGDVSLERGIARSAGRYVENRFCTHVTDRGTADVFEFECQRATPVAYPLAFSGEEHGPSSIVLDEPHDARLETE